MEDCLEVGKMAVKYKHQPKLRDSVKLKLTQQINILIENAPNPQVKAEYQKRLEPSEMEARITATIDYTSQSIVSEELTYSVIRNCLAEHPDSVQSNMRDGEVNIYTNIEGLQGTMNWTDKNFNHKTDFIQDWVIPIVLMWGV